MFLVDFSTSDAYLSLEARLREITMSVMHDATSVGIYVDFYEHEIPHMTKLLYMKVSML
jgi:hypothetical protein